MKGGSCCIKPSLEDTEDGNTAKVLQERWDWDLTLGNTSTTTGGAGKGEREMNTRVDEGMPSVGRSGTQDEGQAGSDPGTRDERPGLDQIMFQTSSVSRLTNLETSDVEIQLLVITFLNDKHLEADNEKTIADTEAESMVSITIQQDTSIIPPMTSPVIDLVSRLDSPNESLLISVVWSELEQYIKGRLEENQTLESRLDNQGSRIHKLETKDWANMIREQTVKFIESYEIDRKIEESVKEVVSSSVKHAMRAPLRARFKDLPTPDMKEILLQRMLEENYDKGHADSD
ncbi:hypothetical protein Tco_0774531 [Tanacetum coccineum]|uniref:Uncharacterized protein n=1 Tax=Tanacetum coccineum TaxID=301880 RepID=A0ABQ4ZPN5_9ASTR